MGRNPQSPYTPTAKASPARLSPVLVVAGAVDDWATGGTGSAYVGPSTATGVGACRSPSTSRRIPAMRHPQRRRGPNAAAASGPRRKWCRLADDDREHVARRQHEVVLAAELHLGAAVLRVDDLVADGDVERDAVAVVVDATGAHCHDLALLGLLLGGVGDHETRRGGLLCLDLLDDDAILERLDGNRHG